MNEESRKHNSLSSINPQGLEQKLEDQLEIEYSPTYWLHNNTVVPTTTQRTTTSTSTQGVHKSIFSTSMSSNSIERITEKSKNGGGDDDDDDDDDENDKTSEACMTKSLSIATSLVILGVLRAVF